MATNFYKYADSPTVYGADNKAFSNANDFFAAGGAKDFSNVQTLNQSTPSLLSASQSSPVVPVNQITPQTPINIPQPSPTPDVAGTVVAGATQASKSLQDYIKELTVAPTETQNQYDSTVAGINELLPQTTGRGSAQLQAEQVAGVGNLKSQLADLNGQIQIKNAEYQQLNAGFEKQLAGAEGKVQTNQSIIGEQAQIRKMQIAESNAKASEVGLLTARAQAVQGNLQAAQETANRAVDLKYQDIESQINLKLKQLDLLKGTLDKEQQVQANALRLKYKAEQTKIAENKDAQKTNLSFAITNKVDQPYFYRGNQIIKTSDGSAVYENQNGTIVRLSDNKKYSTPQQFFTDSGINSWDQIQTQAQADKLLSPTEAARLGVPYGTTQTQASQLGITPSLSTAKTKVGTGTKSTAASNVKLQNIVPKTRTSYQIPSNIGNEDYNNILSGIDNVISQAGGVTDANRWDLWGQVADGLKKANLDPTSFDRLLWDMFYPGGLAAYNADQAAKKASNEPKTSSKITISQDAINNALNSQ